VEFDTYSMNYSTMNDDQNRPSSTRRVEEWVMDVDDRVDLATRRTSMLRNVMCNDDILIVMCPGCLMARVAARTKEGLEMFAELIKTMDEKAMTGLVVSSYCDVGSDRCNNRTEGTDEDENKFVYQFESAASYMNIAEVIDEIACMRSDSNRDEVMFFTSEELVDVCRTMHRVPLKFRDWDIIMPVTEDRWTKMSWFRNSTATGIGGGTGAGP
jgi:hypothetical protein